MSDHLKPERKEDSVFIGDIDFDRVWRGISARIWATEPGGFERLVARVLRSPALARALVATPSLFVAWLLASAIIFVIGAFMTRAMDQPIVPLLAPAVAGIGVSFAYGSAADPAWEITRSTAMPERLLLLVRVVAVFTTNSLIGLIATLLTDQTADLTFLWLLPMAAVALVGLAVAILTDSPTIGSVSALAIWVGVVAATYIDTERAADVISAPRIEESMPVYLILIFASAAIVWLSSSDTWKKGAIR